MLWSAIVARILLKSGDPGRGRGRRPGVGALLGLLLGAAAAHADDTAWRDTEARVQYGYYTEDARALTNVAQALSSSDSHERLRGYYAALSDWRLGLLAAQSPAAVRGTTAAQLLQHCVHELDLALEAQADFAEGLALRAACAVTPAGGTNLHVPFTGPTPHKDIERALALAPKNPRVLFVAAMSDYLLSSSAGGNRERALGKLRAAVAAFEVERAGPEPLPGWGAAEAYLYLGRALLEHGDAVGARDALEHALLLAPDYVQARRLMARIASG
jgi:hypothetical protein